MDIIGEFVGRIYFEIRPFIEWALGNWLPTLALLAGLIFWAGSQRRLRH